MTSETTTPPSSPAGQPQPDADTSPIHWSKLIDVPRGTTPDIPTMTAVYAAQYLAHSQLWQAAINSLVELLDTSEEDAAAERVRVASWEHLPVMKAAFTSAALLQQWAPKDVWDVVNDGDGAETMEEWSWQWLFDVYRDASGHRAPTGSAQAAVVDRLTTTTPAATPRPRTSDETGSQS